VTAITFVAVLDDVTRFRDASQVTSFLGLVPREYSSGERQHKGGITKTGDRHLRSLLVQAAWVVSRSATPAAAPLRHWMQQLARRRGTRVAAVALARRLTRIVYAMWRDGHPYDPQRLGR
jgi:transposase